MATESIHIIDPDSGAGYDYDSLYDWESTEQADLPSGDIIAIAKCRCTGGTADATAVTIDGWSTDATRYIKIWTDTAESYRHVGEWASSRNVYRLVTSSGTAMLTLSEDNIRIYGIEFQPNPSAYSDAYGIVSGSGSGASFYIDARLFRLDKSTPAFFGTICRQAQLSSR